MGFGAFLGRWFETGVGEHRHGSFTPIKGLCRRMESGREDP